MALDAVLSPCRIGNVTSRNRVVRTAHGTRLAQHGQVSDDLIAYHVERAKGGVGLSFVEITSVHPSSASSLMSWSDEATPGFRRLADAVHEEGMLLFQQLWHGGHHAMPADGSPPWSASAVPSVSAGAPPIEMTMSQIEQIVEAFALAARRARDAGIDGVELHAAHGYLIGQFLSPLTNRRTDAYGGSPEGRARFVLEILRAARSEVGSDYPVGVRLSSSEAVHGGLEPDDTTSLVRSLTEEGLIDFVDLSLGGYLNPHLMVAGMEQPHRYQLEYSGRIAARVDVPAIVTGRVMTLGEANSIIESGVAEFVSMVRATIADPGLVRKSTEGRADEVRPCIGCNQGCRGGLRLPVPRIGCTVNPIAGQETRFQPPSPVAAARRVLVVGGGPAGMAAAREAALRGHVVALHEAGPMLGGQVRIARDAPHRAEFGAIVDWMERELGRLGVAVTTDSEITESVLSDVVIDDIVVATGSSPRRDAFQIARPGLRVRGLDQLPTFTSWDVIRGACTGVSCVLLDDIGQYEAIATAEALLEHGCEVTIVTRHSMFAPVAEIWTVAGPARARMAGRPINVLPFSYVREVIPGAVTVGTLDGDVESLVPAEAVVLVAGNVPNDGLLRGAPLPDACGVHVIGDALSHRGLQAAIREGTICGRTI